ncbi:MAG: YbaK/EbsC family protein [Actinobacteria bacterium]|nr:YbaK/EbsC family protein [Actinomycetota bacterium]
MHANCVAVDAVLAAAGSANRVRLLAKPTSTAGAAAEQLGVDVAAIANSLIFLTDAGEPVLIMASGAHRVDLAKAAAAFGAASLGRADAETVFAATGQRIGGVAPVAHPARLRTLVDRDLAAHDVIWAAGGIPQAVFPTTFAELLNLTDGRAAAIA